MAGHHAPPDFSWRFTMAMFGDAKLQSQYDTVLKELQSSRGYTPLSIPEQSIDSITEQLAQIYRPQVEQAIQRRAAATKQQKAAIDVDAASRGMGTSTWVTDAKNRLMGAEASDIAGLETDYASQLAGDALSQYQNYLSNKMQLDQYNQQLAAALDADTYNRVMQQYQSGLVKPKKSGTKYVNHFLGKDGIWYASEEEANASWGNVSEQ